MIEIQHMCAYDLDEAGALIEAAFRRQWLAERMRFSYDLQPQHWFCARRAGRILATVGAHGYDDAASVGMMAVDPQEQRQGIGLLLMSHLVTDLESGGYRQIFLEASTAGAHLYPKLGFVATEDTLHMLRSSSIAWTGGSPPEPACQALPMSAADLPDVIAYDGGVFGRDRSDILRALYARAPARAFVCRSMSGEIAGYVFADNITIGPWAAATEQVAAALLEAALALSYASAPRASFPAENVAAAAMLESAGFTRLPKQLHMYRGAPGDPRDRQRYYGQASLMLG